MSYSSSDSSSDSDSGSDSGSKIIDENYFNNKIRKYETEISKIKENDDNKLKLNKFIETSNILEFLTKFYLNEEQENKIKELIKEIIKKLPEKISNIEKYISLVEKLLEIIKSFKFVDLTIQQEKLNNLSKQLEKRKKEKEEAKSDSDSSEVPALDSGSTPPLSSTAISHTSAIGEINENLENHIYETIIKYNKYIESQETSDFVQWINHVYELLNNKQVDKIKDESEEVKTFIETYTTKDGKTYNDLITSDKYIHGALMTYLGYYGEKDEDKLEKILDKNPSLAYIKTQDNKYLLHHAISQDISFDIIEKIIEYNPFILFMDNKINPEKTCKSKIKEKIDEYYKKIEDPHKYRIL